MKEEGKSGLILGIIGVSAIGIVAILTMVYLWVAVPILLALVIPYIIGLIKWYSNPKLSQKIMKITSTIIKVIIGIWLIACLVMLLMSISYPLFAALLFGFGCAVLLFVGWPLILLLISTKINCKRKNTKNEEISTQN